MDVGGGEHHFQIHLVRAGPSPVQMLSDMGDVVCCRAPSRARCASRGRCLGHETSRFGRWSETRCHFIRLEGGPPDGKLAGEKESLNKATGGGPETHGASS